MPANNQTSAQ